MKHGDKAKRKKASKTTGKKSVKAKISAKSRKAGPVVKAKTQQKASSKAHKQISSKAHKQISGSKSGARGDNGKPRVRLTPDQLTFSNPIVAAAFKRAVKKYPNAFRRLTD